MGEFFKGWRRKAGVVTLAMALVLTAVWMRSVLYYDRLWMWSQQGRLHYVYSANGRILIESPSDRVPGEWFGWHSGPVDRRWLPVGIPYPLLVLPLTLLSAWLILGKRRSANQPPKTA